MPPLTVDRLFRAAGESLALELQAGGNGLQRLIEEPILHRPGLALTGCFAHFAFRRIQILGHAEVAYFRTLSSEDRHHRWRELLEHRVPCVIFCAMNGEPIGGDLLRLADELSVPVFSTHMETFDLFRRSVLILHDLTAPQAAVHGTFVDVRGVGVLLEGVPGVGKSETALGLIRQGNALIADDMTYFTPDTHGYLQGTAPDQMRGFMEIRGLGLLCLPTLFGISSVRNECRLDLIITLRRCDNDDGINRDGSDVGVCEILGIRVPRLIIPVAAGRDFVNLVETAAATHKMRHSGIDAAAILDAQVLAHNRNVAKELKS